MDEMLDKMEENSLKFFLIFWVPGGLYLMGRFFWQEWQVRRAARAAERENELRATLPMLLAAARTGVAIPSETLERVMPGHGSDDWRAIAEFAATFPVRLSAGEHGEHITRARLSAHAGPIEESGNDDVEAERDAHLRGCTAWEYRQRAVNAEAALSRVLDDVEAEAAAFEHAADIEAPGDPHDHYRQMAYRGAAARVRALVAKHRGGSNNINQPNIGDTCCGKCPGDSCYVDKVTGA